MKRDENSLKRPLRRRPEGLLSAVLAMITLCCCAALWLPLGQHNAEDTKQRAESVQLSAGQQVTSVTISTQDSSFTLTLGADGAYAFADGEGIVNQDAASGLFVQLRNLTLAAADGALSLSDCGLDVPGGWLEVTTAGGSQRVAVGDLLPSGGKRYVLYDDAIYTAPLFVSGLPQESAYHAVPTLYTSSDMPERLWVEKQDHTRVSVGVNHGRSLGVTSLAVLEPFEWEMDIEQAAKLIEQVEGLVFTGWAMPLNEENRALCGLDDPVRMGVTYLVDGEEVSWSLLIGGDAGDARYACVEGDDNIFYLSAESAAYFEQLNAANLMNRFAGLISLQAMRALEATWAGGSVTLQVENERMLVNGQEVSEEAFRNLYQQIIAPRVDGMVSIEADADLGPARLMLTYTIVDGSEEQIAYYPLNADYNLLKRNGECLFFVGREKVDAVIDALKDYLP